MNPDVVILGGGLAGLCLARQLLLETDRRVLLVERGEVLPSPRQKVGESTVQLAGDYLGRVLDLEHYLLHEQHIKYNLRFLWPNSDGRHIDDYSQAYVRPFSNLPSYQLDRNTLEAEILRRNLTDPRFELVLGARELDVELVSAGRHQVRFREPGGLRRVDCDWVVDASGRNRVLARKLGLGIPSPIDHGATFWWADGTIDVDRLGPESPRQRRLRPARRALGHSPPWLATVHMCGPGFWFWLIPLRHRTSLGLVYDPTLVPREQVRTADRAVQWVTKRFPMLEERLLAAPIEEWAGFRSYSYDTARVISPDRWAMTGEAGRFSDPLYSPGSDQIALHNGAIVAAIKAPTVAEREQRIALSESLLRALFKAYDPSYATSYVSLGDIESFSLKYTWELAVYFAFYVFPYMNDLFDDRRFSTSFLRYFGKLGPLNRKVHDAVAALARRKLEVGTPADGPHHVDFMEVGYLRDAEKTFYRTGASVEEARGVLEDQLAGFEEMSRWIDTWATARLDGRCPVGAVSGASWRHDPTVLARLAGTPLRVAVPA